MFEEINRRCFFSAKAMTRSRSYKLLLAGFVITIACASTVGIRGQSADPTSEPGAAGEPYPNMPSIAPIGVRIGKHLDVPSSSLATRRQSVNQCRDGLRIRRGRD
jgi:hypothetical protein